MPRPPRNMWWVSGVPMEIGCEHLLTVEQVMVALCGEDSRPELPPDLNPALGVRGSPELIQGVEAVGADLSLAELGGLSTLPLRHGVAIDRIESSAFEDRDSPFGGGEVKEISPGSPVELMLPTLLVRSFGESGEPKEGAPVPKEGAPVEFLLTLLALLVRF